VYPDGVRSTAGTRPTCRGSRGPGQGVEPQPEETFSQIIFTRRAPRDRLSCHARRAHRTVRGRVARRRTPYPRHPDRDQDAELPGSAVFALVWFREKREVALIGRGLEISQATSYRYLVEAIGVLAVRAPDLHAALARGQDEGWSHIVLDGKAVDTDRLRVKTLMRSAASRTASAVSVWATNRSHTAERDVAVAVFSARAPTGSSATG